jgi:hypothetical protein
MWEGQLCLAMKDGSLCYLFKNKGNLYNGHGFKMLAALSQHCHPDLIANAFTSLLSVNNVQGNDEPILQSSEVQSKMIFMGHQISSCRVPVVRSFFIL